MILKVGICSSNEKGFSLLELLLVIFIISLGAAIVFPYILSERDSQQDIKKVSSILKFTYETSLATKNPCTLKIDLQDKSISLDCSNEKKNLKIDSLFAVETTSRGIIKEGVVIITYELGKEEYINIYLSEANSIKKVSLSPLSGRVKIFD